MLAVSDAVDGIYAAVKQSNGSNFFLNRKDTIVLKGYLNKKSKYWWCIVGRGLVV